VLAEKRALSLEELDGQAAFELPSREMLGLITIVITDVLNNNTLVINVTDVNLAVQVCAFVKALNNLTVFDDFRCTIKQF
jgi:hypothetical protein